MKQFDVYATKSKYLVVLNINAKDETEAKMMALLRISTYLYQSCGESIKITDIVELDKFKKEKKNEA